MGQSNEEILAQFRQEVFEEGILKEGDSLGTDDGTLLRFLKARKFNLKQAKKMLSDCQHWRKTVEGVGIDELYSQIDPWDYPGREAVFKCWPMWFHKTDKKGRPLNIHYFGGVDMPKLYKTMTPERHWQTIVVNAEALTREVLPAASRAAGRRIEHTFVIVDLKGFGMSQFWQMKSLARQSFQISQDYFPETMGQLAIVNAPSSFTAIWNVMKPWISKETQEKVEIFGSNYKSFLLNLIDEENLPESLGGTCKCEHIGGCMNGCEGPWLEGRVWPLERPPTEPASGEGEKKSGTVEGQGQDRAVDVSLKKPKETPEASPSSEQATLKNNNVVDTAAARVDSEDGPTADKPQLTYVDVASSNDEGSVPHEKTEQEASESLPRRDEAIPSSSINANSISHQKSDESEDDQPSSPYLSSPPGLDQDEESQLEDRSSSPAPLPVPPPSAYLINGNADDSDSSQGQDPPSASLPLSGPSSSKVLNFLTIPDNTFSDTATEDSVFFTPSEEVPPESIAAISAAGSASLSDDDDAPASREKIQGNGEERRGKHALDAETDSDSIATPTQGTPGLGTPIGSTTPPATEPNSLRVAVIDRC